MILILNIRKPLIFCLLFSSLFMSCKEELKPISNSELVENADQEPNTPVAQLSLKKSSTDYYISAINGMRDNPKYEFDLRDFGTVFVKGWVIDKDQKSLADKVYVCIGDSYFEADYGKIEVPGVVSKYSNEKLLKSGFKCRISKNKLKKGKNILFLSILSSDNKSYYVTGKRDIIL